MSSTLRADIMAELKQAMEAAEEAMVRRDKATDDMFQLYANLLSVNTSPGSDQCLPLHRPPRVNRLTAIRVLARSRSSRPVGFLL